MHEGKKEKEMIVYLTGSAAVETEKPLGAVYNKT
jgi:hypothetical protein